MSEVTESGVSRSRLLKRAAVVGGAAIAWSTPFVTSASAAPTAGLTRSKCRIGGPTDAHPYRLTCDSRCPVNVCGTAPNGTTCYCFAGKAGCCECAGDYFCSSAQTCVANSDCPAGFKCVSSCCDSVIGAFTCAPPCGSGVSSAQASSGRLASGA